MDGRGHPSVLEKRQGRKGSCPEMLGLRGETRWRHYRECHGTGMVDQVG